MESKGKYYLTTAIAYTSAKPHIGNNYEIVLADSIARFKRKEGYDVFFQTGTDEHGQKIELKAEAAGITPKEHVDKIAGVIRGLCDLLNISYDKFIRTTDEDHEKQVQKIFKKLYDQGDIYKGQYEGMYCTPCESFFTKAQLVDGKCPDCGREVQPAKEEAYFFKLSKYADRLIEHINTHPDFIQPESRKNEMMNNFLLPGLQDLCVSRTSFKWGIPVDFDPGHIVYVWIDALTNYITGLGYDVDGNSDELYHRYWPADLHLIGKDIIRFHTIYWPCILMALGEPLPKQVFGHPWLIQSDGKMSKSRGNVIYADDMVDLFGVDAVRYFLLHEMPFENDGIISWELVVERINSELANTLGNLVNRTISMSNKYFGGVVTNTGVTEEVDEDLKNVVLNCRIKVAECMDKLKVADAISEIFTLFKRCNKCIDETMPWALAKEYGGFRNRKAIDMFVKFAKVCFERYQHKVKYWMTFNEINNQMNFVNDIYGWTNSGAHFGNYDNPEEAMYQCAHHTLVASAKAVKIGKEINPDFLIGNMISMVPFYPYSCSPKDQLLAQQLMHDRFFFSDVQCRGHYPAYALKMFERKGFNINITDEDKNNGNNYLSIMTENINKFKTELFR